MVSTLIPVLHQVDTEERFKVAFYHALRNTLVSDNLDTAQTAAFGKDKSGKAQFRVVTLTGEIIEARCVSVSPGPFPFCRCVLSCASGCPCLSSRTRCVVLTLHPHTRTRTRTPIHSGAMSGGGKPRKGGMSTVRGAGYGTGMVTSITEDEVKAAEASLTVAMEAYAQAKRDREFAAAEVRRFLSFQSSLSNL